MNTVQKGDAFENKMFQMISSMLRNNELPINTNHSQVFRKKGYYSEKRKGDIVVDISVECTLPGESLPSCYLMIECKDYSSKVPVNDLEEFYTKTQQITGLNVKAIFLTTADLQQGALDFAISSGIRVMRIRQDGFREVLSFRKEQTAISKDSRDFVNAFLTLTSQRGAISGPVHVGLGPGKVYNTFKSIVEDAILSVE